MNKNIKGFCSLDALAQNSSGATASIGELSRESLTFSRNIQEFAADNRYDELTLHVFSYRNNAGTILSEAVPDNIVAKVIPILDWIAKGSKDGTITPDQIKFKSDINAQFGTATLNIDATQMFSDTIDGINIVVPIQITITETAMDFMCRIWFVDNKFGLEFDETEVRWIQTPKTVDQLAGTMEEVQALITAETRSAYTTKLQQYVSYTALEVMELTWHQLDDNRRTLPTSFTAVIWGPRGRSIEYLRDSLTETILGNSSYKEDDWMVIYPDLFIKDEFTLVPQWDKIAIAAQLEMPKIFSPQLRVKDMLAAQYKFFPNYDKAHVDENASTIPLSWQSISAIACGGNRNTIKGAVFLDAYADYILAAPGTLDWDRMGEETKELVGKLGLMIVEADRFVSDGTYNPPEGMGTVIRGGLVYIQSVIGPTTYLVLSKASYFGERF